MKAWPEWREPLAILLAGAALCFLFDALVFRTRFYNRILDPQSSTGSFEFTLSNEAARDYWARPVLILGNSIIVQGFSPGSRTCRGSSQLGALLVLPVARPGSQPDALLRHRRSSGVLRRPRPPSR